MVGEGSGVTPGELKALVSEAIGEEFERRRSVDSETHAKHHAWCDAQIEAARSRKRMYETVIAAVTASGILTLAGWLIWKVTGYKVGS